MKLLTIKWYSTDRDGREIEIVGLVGDKLGEIVGIDVYTLYPSVKIEEEWFSLRKNGVRD